jgi:hypothetical protein
VREGRHGFFQALIVLAGAAVNTGTVSGSRGMPGRHGCHLGGRRPALRRGLPARRRHAQQHLRQPEPAAALSRRAAGVQRGDERAVRAERLFFFGAFQGAVVRQTPASNKAWVFTDAMLAGDFTALASPAWQFIFNGRATGLSLADFLTGQQRLRHAAPGQLP